MAQYISASRRTDLPRFHAQRFFDAWRKGSIVYDGGYGKRYTVSLKDDDVMGYIFWSKDYSHFINHPDFLSLWKTNNAIFHFTINDDKVLEPGVAPLVKRLDCLKKLCEYVGPERIIWRFDPLVLYRSEDGKRRSNERVFFELLPSIASLGINRCIFSFMSEYKKLRTRPVIFEFFTIEEQIRRAKNMYHAAYTYNVNLYNCCNRDLQMNCSSVKQAQCIDNTLLELTDRFNRHHLLKPKATREGCGCFESRDIGSYNPPCNHGCLYCYANPCSKRAFFA